MSSNESSVKNKNEDPDEDEIETPLVIKLVLGGMIVSVVLTLYMVYIDDMTFAILFLIIFISTLTLGHVRYGDEMNELIDLAEAKSEYKEAKKK